MLAGFGALGLGFGVRADTIGVGSEMGEGGWEGCGCKQETPLHVMGLRVVPVCATLDICVTCDPCRNDGKLTCLRTWGYLALKFAQKAEPCLATSIDVEFNLQ